MPSLQDDLARWGARRTLHIRLMWLLDRVAGLSLYWVTRRDLSRKAARPADAEARLATRESLAPYLDDPSYGLSRDYVEAAFARGDVCVALFAEGRLAGYGWVAYRPVPHEGRVWVAFAPGHRFTTNSFTHPDFRGRHLRGSQGALDELDRQHGATHSISAIHTHNFASLRADARNGAEIVGLAGYLELFGRVLPFRSPGAGKHGFRFHRR